MLLFFDGIALAAPSYMADKLIDSDPVLASPLVERGLLVNFDPDVELDLTSAQHLARTLKHLVKKMPYNWAVGRPNDSCGRIIGHWGGVIAESEGREFARLLKRRGLATPGIGDGWWQVHPRVNLLILMLFAQTLQSCLIKRNVSLHPITCSPELSQGFLGAVLGAAHEYNQSMYAGAQSVREAGMEDLFWQADPDNNLHISRMYYRRREGQRASRLYGNPYFREPIAISEDLRNVGVDLSGVPLDEILDFRAAHGPQYREYARGLREYLSLSSRSDFGRITLERRRALADEAAMLRRLSKKSFGLRGGALLLSLAGAAWTVSRGDSIGALLAALAAAAQAVPPPGDRITIYSYLLQIKQIRE